MPRFPERIREFSGDCSRRSGPRTSIVHHPYESFDVVLQYLRQAVADPQRAGDQVDALSHLAENSPIVAALKEAADSGKSVTAVVELKARFDETTNIRWRANWKRSACTWSTASSS